ncbi:inner membrane protein YhjD [Mycobacterium florentinum]|uniref:Inner membrane protein YhjD n=1 Tax=Mycobacterium florentinum TaxID=292462 RepID=A0A1X1UI18_MYCFL|nr:inner membrane protein YhjD [Mycobacterium florentinum]MCV7409294.1 inner membrane protein YhjD [Mycobacterium florentinum]ORV56472.1 inner membrane protein YhjD [Mycobacterium florentinum]BBX78510.1 inner membrane protein YhjD [Mycobacterium florentinum]
MDEPAKPGILDRLRARFGWLDHVLRAYKHFDERNGGFLAAALTYYTIFALFPLLMVGFAVVGFMLAEDPKLLASIDEHIRDAVDGELGQQLVDLMNSAINARTSVGVIGLAASAWAGLGWMSHMRGAVTEMWWDEPLQSPGFVRGKLSDLVAMVGTFVVILATIALTALGHAAPMRAVLKWAGVPNFSIFGELFRGLSIVVSLLVSWMLFTWMIGRLPRHKVSLADSARAGLLAAIGFELFKQVASIYLRVVLRSPAGATFGPVLGLMVFSYITGYLVLFATAWAATLSTDPRSKYAPPPAPAIIAPRVLLDEGISTRQTLTAIVMGAVGALAFSRLTRWLR